MNPVIIAITGASGAIYGIRALQLLRQLEVPAHLVISRAGQKTIAQETDWTIDKVNELAEVVYEPEQIGATIASGSFITRGMLIIPCSVKTLSAVANSYSENLIARAADVTLKEGRPLILVFRETPLHRGHIRLMNLASQMGAVIFPPVPAFYDHPQTIDDLVTKTVGRILYRLGIENHAFENWIGPDC